MFTVFFTYIHCTLHYFQVLWYACICVSICCMKYVCTYLYVCMYVCMYVYVYCTHTYTFLTYSFCVDDGKADVWSLGITLLELCEGKYNLEKQYFQSFFPI